ncbi:MAG: hypothetical protein GC191_02955 [Azospirillum sp.]|nr:hypothetical protein [Azospirillum sp.]
MTLTIRNRISAVLVVLAISGCTAILPKPETTAFIDATNAVSIATDALLTLLESAERRNGLEAAQLIAMRDQEIRPGTPRDRWFMAFDPKMAVWYSDFSDPPLTAALKRMQAGLAAYAKVLLALVDGTPVEETRDRITKLASNASVIVGLLGGAIPQPVTLAFNVIRQLAEEALQFQNAENFRRLVEAGYPQVELAITAVKNYSPVLFELLVKKTKDRWALAMVPPVDAAVISQTFSEMEGVRVLLSNYLMLLDAQQQALHELKLAAIQNVSPISLQSIADQSDRLRLQAELTKRAATQLSKGR